MRHLRFRRWQLCTPLAGAHRAAGDDDNGGSAVERDQIDPRHKWKLERVFPDWTTWEADYAEVEAALPGLAALQGTLGRSAGDLHAAIEHDPRDPAPAGGRVGLRVHAQRRGHAHGREHRPPGARRQPGGAFRRGGQLVRARAAGRPARRCADCSARTSGCASTSTSSTTSSAPARTPCDADGEALLAAAGNVTRGAEPDLLGPRTTPTCKFPTIVDEEGQRGRADQGALLASTSSPAIGACAATPSRPSSTPTAG